MAKEYDIIIVGSGFAGLFAAIEATKNGDTVVMLEKMPHPGGSSILCNGQLAVPGSDEQKATGIHDSMELLQKDMLTAGRGLNNLQLIHRLAEEIPAIYDFLRSLDIKFKKEVQQFSGHSAPRILLTENESGRDIYTPLFEHSVQSGMILRTNTLVERVLVDENDNPSGLRVREKYNFNDPFSGEIVNYKFKKALIIASGSWGADKKFIALQNPAYQKLETTGHPGATSECLRFLLGINAIPIMLNSYQLGPWSSPDEEGAHYGAKFADHALAGGILVDTATGERFVNEMADWKVVAESELRLVDGQLNPRYPLLICSTEAANRSSAKDDAIATNVLKEFDSAEDVAKYYEIPLTTFLSQIHKWNQYVAKNHDAQYNKLMKYSAPINGKVYVMRIWPKVHYCNGGVAVSEYSEVLNIATLNSIPKVYACGEIAGGLHGDSRIAAVSALSAMVFGKIAGIHSRL